MQALSFGDYTYLIFSIDWSPDLSSKSHRAFGVINAPLVHAFSMLRLRRLHAFGVHQAPLLPGTRQNKMAPTTLDHFQTAARSMQLAEKAK